MTIAREVRLKLRPPPNDLPCTDCGATWEPGAPRHEYDHHLGYAPQHHSDVEAVCTKCHARRDSRFVRQTHCVNGHPFDEANTQVTKEGHRRCRACSRLYYRRRVGRG